MLPPSSPSAAPAGQPRISLKSLTLDARGNLARRRMVGPLDFSFTHLERRYACRFYERSARSGLILSLALGHLPEDKQYRALVRRAVRDARACGVTVVIRRSGQLELEQRSAPLPPVSGFTLLAQIALDLSRAQPWIDVLEDILAAATAAR